MKVCQVVFRYSNRRNYFNPRNLEVKALDYVVAETTRGLEVGKVVGDLVDCPKELEKEVKPLLRIATDDDMSAREQIISEEEDALRKCKELVRKHNLDMKLVGCEYLLDRSKFIIYFEAEQRIDFRLLVRDIAEEFRVRIELRQIGSRDTAMILGGIGPCGLVICCRRFIREFENISIKMAKNQNLSLNPQKISGACNKFLCCIKYENEHYLKLWETVPDINDIVTIEGANAKVLAVDVLNRTLKVKMLADETFRYLSVDEVVFKKSTNEKRREKDDD